MAVLKALGQLPIITYDDYTKNIIDVMNTDPSGVPLSSAERMYVRTLVAGLKKIKGVFQTEDVWTRAKNSSSSIWGVVGTTAWKHKFNWLDPKDTNNTHRLVFPTAMIHSGYGFRRTTASNDEIDANFNLAATYNSIEFTMVTYVNELFINPFFAMWGMDMGYYILDPTTNNIFLSNNDNANPPAIWFGVGQVNGNSKGVYTLGAIRTGTGILEYSHNSNEIKAWLKSELLYNSTAIPNFALPNASIKLGGYGGSRRSGNNFSFAVIFPFLADDEIVQLNFLLRYCQGILGRQG